MFYTSLLHGDPQQHFPMRSSWNRGALDTVGAALNSHTLRAALGTLGQWGLEQVKQGPKDSP